LPWMFFLSRWLIVGDDAFIAPNESLHIIPIHIIRKFWRHQSAKSKTVNLRRIDNKWPKKNFKIEKQCTTQSRIPLGSIKLYLHHSIILQWKIFTST
jgi:hypothetical protein